VEAVEISMPDGSKTLSPDLSYRTPSPKQISLVEIRQIIKLGLRAE
jgi:hypothetical protein